MTAEIYNFPCCDKGTSTPVINIRFVNIVNRITEPIDMRDVDIELNFYASGRRDVTPNFILSTGNGKIITDNISSVDESGSPITLSGEDGWISILTFISDYGVNHYEYTSKFTFPDDTILSYIKGTFSIT